MSASSADSKKSVTTVTGPIFNRHPIERGELHPLRDSCDLTASDVPTLFGFGYESLQQLADRKRTGQSQRFVSQFVKELCERGHALEVPTFEYLDRKHKRSHKIADFYTMTVEIDGVPATFGASPDGIYESEDRTWIEEVKNPLNSTDISPNHHDAHAKQKWWQYWLQVQFQLHVSQNREAELCVWHPVLRPREWEIRLIPEWWDQAFLPAFRRFRQYSRPGLGAVKVPRWPTGYREEVYAWMEHLHI